MRKIISGTLRLATLGWLALGGCDSADLPAPSPTFGALVVTITPAEFGLGRDLDITITGPDGVVYELGGFEATRRLNGLEPGTYTVRAGPLTGLHPVVGTAQYDPSISDPTVVVTAGEAASVTVSYTRQPGGAGVLWIANAGHPSLVSYSADRLLASTEDAPNTVISTGDLQYGAVFDVDGDLWLSQAASARLVKYTASQMAAGGAPTPAVVLSTNAASVAPGAPASLEGPMGLAFDHQGYLWVANSDNNTVVAFAPSQLEHSGTPTPLITLSSNGGSLDEPVGLTYLGDLWVANRNSNTVVAFSTAQQARSGAPVPAVTLRSTALVAPSGLAFTFGNDDYSEADDYLWVSNVGSNTVVRFSGDQLLTGGAVFPKGTLNANPLAPSLSGPTGLLFDQSGALWVANQSGNTVVRFAQSQVLAGGAQTPEVIVSGVALAAPTVPAAFLDPTAISSRAAEKRGDVGSRRARERLASN